MSQTLSAHKDYLLYATYAYGPSNITILLADLTQTLAENILYFSHFETTLNRKTFETDLR